MSDSSVQREKKVINLKSSSSSSSSLVLDIIFTLIGSLPMIIIAIISTELLYKDYILNNNHFWGQSKFFSNVKPHDWFENQTCSSNSEICSSTKFCARYFTDHILDKEEALTLLKIAQDGFSFGTDLSSSYNSFDYESGILIENRKVIDIKKILEAKNEPLYNKAEFDVYNNVLQKVMKEIKDKFQVNELYKVEPVYFLRLSNTSKVVDFLNQPLNSYCYTTLIMLNSWVINVEGGRFVFKNNNELIVSIQPRPGRLIAFTPSSLENQVYLEQVVSKYSHILFAGFRCNKK